MSNKESRSIQEQIDLLKHRGMIIEDEEFAHLHLSHISYYRLKGYWWDMQKDKENHVFQTGSRFEDVIARYSFDKELRLILFDVWGRKRIVHLGGRGWRGREVACRVDFRGISKGETAKTKSTIWMNLGELEVNLSGER